MGNLILVSDYRHNERLRESFNSLAMQTFNLDFSRWYGKGYWNEQYVPYSFVDEGKVIANASVFKMSIVIKGVTYHGVQVGTVMTDVNYRNQGLAKQLMKHIMKVHENTCDFMYLFANDTVLNFYPRFGFIRFDESEFCLELAKSSIQMKADLKVQKLTIKNDLELLERYAKDRHANASSLGVIHNENLLLFYFTVAFRENIFYIEELKTLVLLEEEKDTLHIFDIISLDIPNVESILSSILKKTTKKVVFHFTPDFVIEGMTATVISNDADALFVLTNQPLLEGHFKFPITSHC